jgi:hypothetical protein
VVLDRAFIAAGHEHELVDAGRQAFLYGILNERTIDDRKHLLRHCLGGGQEPGAQSGNWQNRFSNALRHAQ